MIISKLDFRKVVNQEKDYLNALYSTPSDIPGCFNLFETYMGCNALRSQVKAIYRFGGRPHCSDKAEDLKFCLTLKALHPEEQREAWIQRRAEWWAHRRLNKSSEDVWEIRETPLQNYPLPLGQYIDETPLQ